MSAENDWEVLFYFWFYWSYWLEFQPVWLWWSPTKTVETNLYKSLNTSFSIKKIENGQTFKLSDLASVSKIKGLENVSPELETVAKLKDKEAVSGEQSVERDDLSAADKNLVSLTALEDSSKGCYLYQLGFQLKRRATSSKKGIQRKFIIQRRVG